LLFTQSLDDKSESLMRSVTTQDVVFGGTLFADIGLGAPAPLIGQDVIVESLLGLLTMPTSHHLSHFRVQVSGSQANLTAYLLSHHYRLLEQPRENPRNKYEMANRYQAGVVREGGGWKIEWLKVIPAWQSGNLAVMGLNGTKLDDWADECHNFDGNRDAEKHAVGCLRLKVHISKQVFWKP
jgi:hypothetical protein